MTCEIRHHRLLCNHLFDLVLANKGISSHLGEKMTKMLSNDELKEIQSTILSPLDIISNSGCSQFLGYVMILFRLHQLLTSYFPQTWLEINSD